MNSRDVFVWSCRRWRGIAFPSCQRTSWAISTRFKCRTGGAGSVRGVVGQRLRRDDSSGDYEN